MRLALLAVLLLPVAVSAQQSGRRTPPRPPRTEPVRLPAPAPPVPVLTERAAALAEQLQHLNLEREHHDAELLALSGSVHLLEDAEWQLAESVERVRELEHLAGSLSAPLAWNEMVRRPRAAWAQDDPADSLYREARTALNRGEYRRASSLFGEIPTRFTDSRYAADALYWRAFALYRIGNVADLRTARTALATQGSRYPSARTQADAEVLSTRILGALAARGDAEAARVVRGRAATAPDDRCDREEQSVRSEALQAVVRTDPENAVATLRSVLARRDSCSGSLRLRAVSLVRSLDAPTGGDMLTDVVRNDPEPGVRSAALGWLARLPGERNLAVVMELLRSSDDLKMQQAAVRALAGSTDPRARQALRATIERRDANQTLRRDAISRFGSTKSATPDDADFLRGVYSRETDLRVKSTLVSALARMDRDGSQEWLSALVENQSESIDARTAALSGIVSTDTPIATLGRLYDRLSERPLRQRIISSLGRRKEPEATDKLIDIARAGTDPSLRRSAIGALTRKNDPRTTRLLLEIINK